jgi:ferredoxin
VKVAARRSTCEGGAACMLALPDRFIIGDDGKAVVIDDEVDEDDYEDVAAVIRNCPTNSLRMTGY